MVSQDLSTTGLEGCQPASGDDAFHDWFLFLRYFFSAMAWIASLLYLSFTFSFIAAI